jgi:Zn-dependent alcohol dehydrogenase
MKSRAAVLYAMEQPVPYSRSKPLVVEEIEVAEPGHGQVLVEIAAAGLCHSDLSVINGSRPRVMPMVMGHEASGIVREAGRGVRELSPGDHVVFSFVPSCRRCVPCVSGRPALCERGAKANAAGSLLDGKRCFRDSTGAELHHHLGVSAFSQFTIAAEESLVKIDPAMPLDVAALFGCAVMTGVGAVLNTARVEAGTSVAIFGLGGVGLSTLLGARLAGAYPIIAVDLLDAKLDKARSLGATHSVNAGTDDAVRAVRDLSGGGAHYAFESVGSERALIQAYEATRRGGTTVTIGLPHPKLQFAISAVSLVAEERTVKGSYMGSAVPGRDIPRYIALQQAGLLPVERLLTRTIGLEEVNEAFDSLDRGDAVRQLIRFQSALS